MNHRLRLDLGGYIAMSSGYDKVSSAEERYRKQHNNGDLPS